jgi:hypothetical protein
MDDCGETMQIFGQFGTMSQWRDSFVPGQISGHSVSNIAHLRNLVRNN